MKNQRVEVIMPNNPEYLEIVQKAMAGLCEIMKFSDKEVKELSEGVKNAVDTIVKYVYKEDEEAIYKVFMERKALGLEVIIQDKGIPFDPSMIEKYNPDAQNDQLEKVNLGHLLDKLPFDEVTFHNKGKEGMETILFKYQDQHIHHLEDKSTFKGQESPETSSEKPITYTVRQMKPEEAVDVSRLAYYSYGYTYLNDDIYYPDRLRELNRRKDFISYIAVTDDGEVISHNAFERRADRGIPELGVAFTKPEFRGKGCLNRLIKRLLDDAPKLGFTGVFAEGVTSHPYSQKSLMKFGFKDCALKVSIFEELLFKKIERQKTQRESVMIAYYSVKNPKKLIIHPPLHHADMIKGIYEHIGFNPEIFIPDENSTPGNDHSVLSVTTNTTVHTADIIIKTFGKDVVAMVHRTLRNLCLSRTETIFLRMKLIDPFTSIYTEEFESMGFFFSGIIPRSEVGDELILQYMNNYEIDFDQLKIASEKGKEILEYVKNAYNKIQDL